MTIPVPDPNPDVGCWPVDTECCSEFLDYDPLIQDRAIMLATESMRSLTAYRVGGCPITVRPCATGCATLSATNFAGSWTPVNYNGNWSNCGCSGGCLCGALTLPPPVGEIAAVTIDGADFTDYALADGNKLVRTDGEQWPATNDMTLPDTEVGTWSVTYLNGLQVNALGAYAAGILACEFAKACSGAACRLPANVVSIIRAGVQMQMLPGTFPGGKTGIREVDAYVRQYNPQGFVTPPAVWSPNRKRPVTWQQ